MAGQADSIYCVARPEPRGAIRARAWSWEKITARGKFSSGRFKSGGFVLASMDSFFTQLAVRKAYRQLYEQIPRPGSA